MAKYRLAFFLDFLTLEVGTHSLSQNVSEELYAAYYPRRAQITSLCFVHLGLSYCLVWSWWTVHSWYFFFSEILYSFRLHL